MLRDGFGMPPALLRFLITLCASYYSRALACNHTDFEFSEYVFKMGKLYESLHKDVADSFNSDVSNILALLDKVI